MPAVRTTKSAKQLHREQLDEAMVLDTLPRGKNAPAKSGMSAADLKEESKAKIKKIATTKDKRMISGIARIFKDEHDSLVRTQKERKMWYNKGKYTKEVLEEYQKKIDELKEKYEVQWEKQQKTMQRMAAKE